MSIGITKMTSKGQVVIPQEVRKDAKLKVGEGFIVYNINDSVVLKKVHGAEKAKNREEFDRVFKSIRETAKKQGITQKDVAREIAAVRRGEN